MRKRLINTLIVISALFAVTCTVYCAALTQNNSLGIVAYQAPSTLDTNKSPSLVKALDDNELVITKTVYPESTNETILYFNNNRQIVSVLAEGQIIYTLGDENKPIKFGTTCYCTVRLPQLDKPYTIQVYLKNPANQKVIEPELMFGTENEVLKYLFNLDTFTIMFIPAVFGAVALLLAAFAVALVYHVRPRTIFSAVTFMIYATVYLITELKLMAVLPINPEVVSVICNYMLMFIPITALYFIKHTCSPNEKAYTVFLVVEHMSIIIQSSLYMLGITRLYDTVPISQLMFVLIGIYAVYIARKNYKAHPRIITRILYCGFSITMVVMVFTLLAFWIYPSEGIYLKGLPIFVASLLFTMIVYMLGYIKSQIDIKRVMEAQAEADRKALFIDSLTGLGNRRAFDKAIEAIDVARTEHSDLALILVDLDGLKYVNDAYGRTAGDEMLVTAAKCIREGFEGVGQIYRVNGDDFSIIASVTHETIKSCFEKVDKAFERTNKAHAVKISASRGYSFLKQDDRLLTIAQWKEHADRQLYEDKVSKRNSKMELGDGYMQLISGFISAVDAKDHYTAAHSTRVGDMTNIICGLLGISSATTNEVEMAAKLHDIGKIGVPDSILMKPAKLDDNEWAVLKTHPALGEQIVKQIHSFYEVGQMIRSHHERIDGKGYPDGLKDDEIPLGARIISIADAIDAMCTTRVYRGSLTADYCKEQLETNLGIMFDKTIGQIVLDNWEIFDNFIRVTHSAEQAEIHLEDSKIC